LFGADLLAIVFSIDSEATRSGASAYTRDLSSKGGNRVL